MPPRFSYWTIILEGKPTAFRAHDRDELKPTFKQLQRKHPDIILKWFARGRLWESPEEAQLAQRVSARERRPLDWRPGGQHRDPRARFKVPRDVKRSRVAAKRRRDSRDRLELHSPDKSTPESGSTAERAPHPRERPGAERVQEHPKPKKKTHGSDGRNELRKEFERPMGNGGRSPFRTTTARHPRRGPHKPGGGGHRGGGGQAP
jgi:hypothetical protein